MIRAALRWPTYNINEYKQWLSSSEVGKLPCRHNEGAAVSSWEYSQSSSYSWVNIFSWEVNVYFAPDASLAVCSVLSPLAESSDFLSSVLLPHPALSWKSGFTSECVNTHDGRQMMTSHRVLPTSTHPFLLVKSRRWCQPLSLTSWSQPYLYLYREQRLPLPPVNR